jgi:4-amino-4-deoxychorismate lyase
VPTPSAPASTLRPMSRRLRRGGRSGAARGHRTGIPGNYGQAVTDLVLLDGLQRIDPSTPVLRGGDLGVLHGEAAFETVRIASGRPALLAQHLARLSSSAERLDIALPPGFDRLAQTACEGQGDGVLRLVCTKGPPPVGYALVAPIPDASVRARKDGVRVITLTLGVAAHQRSEAPWLLGGVKTTSYAVNMASLRQAAAAGADDAIWVSSDGEVLEGVTSAVAIVRHGILVTPPDSLGILASTTLAAVLELELAPATVRRIGVAELRDADEVMLLSSIRGVVPVVQLDDRALPAGSVTAQLSQAFEASLHS